MTTHNERWSIRLGVERNKVQRWIEISQCGRTSERTYHQTV